ncbi:MAG: bifunctional 5,10-methylenetetrahydrofolate dehydrogenase/5,10-methenyltetrahydrofolate cyclohydrolase [Fibrobacterota bacterium]|nr:bifunctional 5,10-methylenetetrahydrofolate dehydrogenase/5,10-methenyltetrahydrofolate cyclohydrolase [Fibrobacterota bacterium]QQS06904.1 MAG: bifunctional 5,10-methylenetetrahydrofolate dehydrogenase/5,10-methenyltetrahydrofolate cyclohydrolase [Fibrobacterota bacterium]
MQLLAGKPVVDALRAGLLARIQALKERGITPCLTVTLVGDDPSSHIYVNAKDKDAKELGIESHTYRFPATMSQADLEAHVRKLSADPKVHGILVQSPLPKGLDESRVVDCIDPTKDVDGFHPQNVGLLCLDRPGHRSCTPWGVIQVLKHYGISTAGKRAVVIGRSDIVGRPMANLLIHKGALGDATLTVAHSRTADLASVVREADIVVAAIGKAEFVKGSWLKPGAVVIDVGINRVEDASIPKGYKVVGDVEFSSAQEVASAITPVPGCVGLMTRAILMSNTVDAAERLS